jgi:hypothetical protein
MELILKETQVTIPQAIENIQYLRKELKDQLEYYEGIIVTPDTIKNAKSDKAALNKLKTAIDNQRKAVKKDVMALYEPLEAECKELLGMIDRPIEAIDKQLKAFDEQKKAEKYAALTELFGKINCNSFVKLDDVLNPKWGNSTVKLDTLKQEVAAEVERISFEYTEIKRLYAGHALLPAILERFEQTRDKGAALAYAAEMERKEKERQEREQAEQARREREAAEKARREQEPRETEQIQRQPNETIVYPTIAPTPPEPMITGTFRVTGTRAQIIALRDFLKASNINFEILKY